MVTYCNLGILDDNTPNLDIVALYYQPICHLYTKIDSEGVFNSGMQVHLKQKQLHTLGNSYNLNIFICIPCEIIALHRVKLYFFYKKNPSNLVWVYT